MKDKYYTPSIEEFHVGFEYETPTKDNVLYDVGKGIWEKKIVSDKSSFGVLGHDVMYGARVKYLDQEDIESLGFEFKYNEKNNENIAFTKKYDNHPRYDNQCVDIIWNHVSNHILICEGDNETCWSDWVIRFSGKIKNKSELKRILKQIGYE